MNFREFLNPACSIKYISGQSLKIYKLLNKLKNEYEQYIPKNAQLFRFMVLRIFTKHTFRHRLTANPDYPVQFNIEQDLVYFEHENILTEEKALQRIKQWDDKRLPADTINDQFTGFQILKANGKLSVGYKKSFFLFWTSIEPHSKIFLEIPGYPGEDDQVIDLSVNKKYIRDDKDMCFRPEEFLYNSEKFTIKPSLFV